MTTTTKNIALDIYPASDKADLPEGSFLAFYWHGDQEEAERLGAMMEASISTHHVLHLDPPSQWGRRGHFDGRAGAPFPAQKSSIGVRRNYALEVSGEVGLRLLSSPSASWWQGPPSNNPNINCLAEGEEAVRVELDEVHLAELLAAEPVASFEEVRQRLRRENYNTRLAAMLAAHQEGKWKGWAYYAGLFGTNDAEWPEPFRQHRTPTGDAQLNAARPHDPTRAQVDAWAPHPSL